MGGEYLQRIYMADNNTIVRFATTDRSIDIRVEDRWNDDINNYNKNNNIVPYCIVPGGNGLSNCANLFSNNPYNINYINNAPSLNGVSLTAEGPGCRTFSFRPGTVIKSGDTENEYVKGYIVNGNLCTINFSGPPLTPEYQMGCCLNQNCDEIFSNNFSNESCDTVMTNYCASNYNEDICMTWLYNRTTKYFGTGLEFYKDICSKDMNQEVCSYFSLYANNESNGYYYHYSDIALDNYCSANVEDPNCVCYLEKKNNKNLQNMEETLGPSECWLIDCTAKLKDLKWITHEQRENKKKCNGINCLISVQSLTSDAKSIINLNNYCLNKNSETSSIAILNNNPQLSITKEQTWGSQFNIFFIVLFLFISLFMIVLYRKIK